MVANFPRSWRPSPWDDLDARWWTLALGVLLRARALFRGCRSLPPVAQLTDVEPEQCDTDERPFRWQELEPLNPEDPVLPRLLDVGEPDRTTTGRRLEPLNPEPDVVPPFLA